MTDIEKRNEELIKEFLKSKNSKNTKASYKSDLKSFADYVKKDLLEVSIFDVIDYFDKIEEEKSNPTLRRYLASIREFYDLYSLNADYAKVNPTIKIDSRKYPVSNTSPSEPLSYDQSKKLINHIKKEIKNAPSRLKQLLAIRNLAMLSLLLTTGMRISETIYLDFTELDTNGWEIHLTEEKTKGKKDRDIDLQQNTIERLQDYLAIRDELFKGKKCSFKYKDEERDLVFGSHNAKPLGSNQMNAIWKEYGNAEDVQIKGLHSHICRVSFVSEVYSKTLDLALTQDIIGHSNSSVTRRYIKLEKKKIKDINIKFANL